MTTTSRQPIIDIIELIANLIASASHLQEMIENEEDFDKRDEYTNQLYELIDIRREVMKQIECKDNTWRCSLKHSIAQWNYALEVYYADRNKNNEDIVSALTKYMYTVISRYMGVDVVNCSRCLEDQILSSNKQDETTD